jgi:benzoyl-CoA reductase/2-hydroxyglutaryl-CoA dehydratase subunit BcrC/BadD/HgdB
VNRTAYLIDQKARQGRPIVGVFPGLYPKEMLWAHGLLPAEMWDPPLRPARAQAHLQAHVCSVVQADLELVLTDQAELLDGLLCPATCDAVQNVGSLIHDFLAPELPVFYFHHPVGTGREAARRHYLARLKRLGEDLTARFGPAPDGELARRVAQGRRLDHLVSQVYDRLAAGNLGLTNAQAYDLLRRGEYLWPDDWEAELLALLEQSASQPGGDQLPVLLGGYLPGPPGFLELLDELGLAVAGDDLLACGRRLPGPPAEAAEPFEALALAYLNRPPCSTRGGTLPARLDRLLGLVLKSQAQGVIFSLIKFCEPELFDLPSLQAGLRAAGRPSLVIETAVGEPLTGQIRTRLEAFREMIA